MIGPGFIGEAPGIGRDRDEARFPPVDDMLPVGTYGDGNLLDAYPGLIEQCPSSGYLTLSAGDVTVHSDLCVHAAGQNISGEPRWTYLVQLNPADARWTGAPAVSFDTSTLQHLGTLDEARFPTVG